MSSKVKELRDMPIKELKILSVSLLKEMAKLRFQRGMGDMVQTHRFSALRRERARVKTVINERGCTDE